MIKGEIYNRINLFVGGLILFSLMLFPDISLSAGLPKFKFIDFLLPVIGVLLFLQRARIRWEHIYKFVLIYVVYIAFVIIYNGRQDIMRDYFELYKLIKFLGVILFFTLIDYKQFFKFWIKPTFVIVIIGNLIHYFEFFGLNSILEEHYNGGIHIQLFGLNSLGEPDMKRMVGFAGNPNINALVFAFFTVLFLPKLSRTNSQYYWFFGAVFMFFLCQSRTNFVALIVVLMFMFHWNRNQTKFNLKVVGLVAIAFILSFLVSSNSYINLLFDKKIVQNNSLLGRFEVWKLLWEMIKEKPLFGHGPFKEYFYERELYVENEYILQTWRYGFVGLFVFLGILLSPFQSAWKNKSLFFSFEFIAFSLFILLNSLMNTPFTNPTINLLFAITIGLYYSDLRNKKAV